jgi:hypothetical protein
MNTIHLLLVCGTTIALAAIAASAVLAARLLPRGGSDAPPARVGHRVTVHTKKPDDQTLHGVVVGDYADRLSLANASYVTPERAVPIDAQRHDIDKRDIAWIDVYALVADETTSRQPEAAGP